ncbi:hypothetical protein JW979_05445 [bacterium]|nr:hypothetical protein [candidate division CSSED10-310 bacterium]
MMDYEVSTFWSLVVEIGFFGWIGSTIAFIFKGFDDKENLNKKRALFWGLMIVLFYAIWVTGLVNA